MSAGRSHRKRDLQQPEVHAAVRSSNDVAGASVHEAAANSANDWRPSTASTADPASTNQNVSTASPVRPRAAGAPSSPSVGRSTTTSPAPALAAPMPVWRTSNPSRREAIHGASSGDVVDEALPAELAVRSQLGGRQLELVVEAGVVHGGPAQLDDLQTG